jgi:hypothetical protein
MREKAFLPKQESEEQLVSGVRERSSLRLPSVPGMHLREAQRKIEETKGVHKSEIYKLTGQAADKLTRLEMRLKQDLKKAENELVKEEILEKLSECDDLAKILTVHIDDLVEQEGKIAQRMNVEMASNPTVEKQMLENQREALANLRLTPDSGLKPLLRKIDEFIEENSFPEQKISRAA